MGEEIEFLKKLKYEFDTAEYGEGISYNLSGMSRKISDRINKLSISETKASDESVELIECIQNLMGVFDTPVSRRLISNDFADEARKIGRKILDNHSIKNKDGIK